MIIFGWHHVVCVFIRMTWQCIDYIHIHLCRIFSSFKTPACHWIGIPGHVAAGSEELDDDDDEESSAKAGCRESREVRRAPAAEVAAAAAPAPAATAKVRRTGSRKENIPTFKRPGAISEYLEYCLTIIYYGCVGNVERFLQVWAFSYGKTVYIMPKTVEINKKGHLYKFTDWHHIIYMYHVQQLLWRQSQAFLSHWLQRNAE